MHILCRFIGHKRNKRHVRPWRDSWQSECIVCAERLARIRRGKWVPISSFGVVGNEFRIQEATTD